MYSDALCKLSSSYWIRFLNYNAVFPLALPFLSPRLLNMSRKLHLLLSDSGSRGEKHIAHNDSPCFIGPWITSVGRPVLSECQQLVVQMDKPMNWAVRTDVTSASNPITSELRALPCCDAFLLLLWCLVIVIWPCRVPHRSSPRGLEIAHCFPLFGPSRVRASQAQIRS